MRIRNMGTALCFNSSPSSVHLTLARSEGLVNPWRFKGDQGSVSLSLGFIPTVRSLINSAPEQLSAELAAAVPQHKHSNKSALPPRSLPGGRVAAAWFGAFCLVSITAKGWRVLEAR